MNSIRRAITIERRRFLTIFPTYLLQQHSSLSSSTSRIPKTSKTSKTNAREVKSQPAPPKASSSSNLVVPKDSAATWPKPSEISWQAKFVNSVNLIGQVRMPVQVVSTPEGKYWAGTIISQEDDSSASSTSPKLFWISVVFEGDLAHCAVSHLRENDYIHIAGHLSVDAPPVKLSEGQANVQVMVHSINFVQGAPQSIASSKLEQWAAYSAEIPNQIISNNQSSKELNSKTCQLDILPKQESSMDAAFEHEDDGQLLKIHESTPDGYILGVEYLNSDGKVDKKRIDATWRGLLNNPKEWLDNREKKRKRLVKATFPDFSHKDTGAGLWLDNAEEGVLQGLGQLEFYSPPNKAREAFEHEGDGQLLKNDDSTAVEYPNYNRKIDKRSIDASWDDLLNNREQWLDNREKKRKGLVKANYPDFKHKVTGDGIWLDRAPAMVLQELGEFYSPPSEAPHKGKNDGVSWKGDVDGDPWRHLIENPGRWWDNRNDKKYERSPDFKNKDSGKALWLGDAPAWALSSLKEVDEKKAGASWAA